MMSPPGPTPPADTERRADLTALELGLIHLPYLDEPSNAQVALSSRRWAKDEQAAGFWRMLARHVDLTGKRSLVRRKQPGMFDNNPVARLESGLASVEARIAQFEKANVLLDEAKIKPLDLHRNVAAVIKEVTPQFFLRNIARLERDVNVRRLPIRYAVWRTDGSAQIETAKMKRLDPVEYIPEFTPQSMERLRRERHASVHGFAWEEEITGHITVPARRNPFRSGAPDRIPVGELSLKPAPPNRQDAAEQHAKTLKQLGQRYDATRDPGDKRG